MNVVISFKKDSDAQEFVVSAQRLLNGEPAIGQFAEIIAMELKEAKSVRLSVRQSNDCVKEKA